MPNGDARHGHSANLFKVTGRLKEEINQKPKRLREGNNPSPEIFVETPSTATLVEESSILVEESSIFNLKFLSLGTHNRKGNNYLAIKLNPLKDKQVRFESHKEFLSCCIKTTCTETACTKTISTKTTLIPKRLGLMLEPTITNHHQSFLDRWYSKLKQFSLSLMKDIVQFCDKTIDETTTEISTTETSLKSNTNQEQFKAIQSQIKNNETAARKIL